MEYEILAPAGNLACAEAAINNGANAIYLGLNAFSARAGADNFDEETLLGLIKKAKLLGVKIYVAMNTLIKNEELDEFLRSLLKVWSFAIAELVCLITL
jgi:putative protease